MKAWLKRWMAPRAPEQLSKNFKKLEASGLAELEASLRRNYFSQGYLEERQSAGPGDYLDSAAGRKDLQDHLTRRLDGFRNTVIPWLAGARSLAGASILEIGCGTGSSTVALAEQGASVVAVDVVAESLEVAKTRCKAYGLDVELFHANATEAGRLASGRRFDFIIFFACLEHMTHEERMLAMKQTWDMLGPGGLWCVIETPNRLWYYDGHTSFLPFYLWLPDDLAFQYSRFSPRPSFSGSYREPSEEAELSFLRRGRGVSFHEFDLTLGKAEGLDVVSSLSIELRRQSLIRSLRWRQSVKHRYSRLLASVGPKLHPGFYEPSLDLILRKGPA